MRLDLILIVVAVAKPHPPASPAPGLVQPSTNSEAQQDANICSDPANALPGLIGVTPALQALVTRQSDDQTNGDQRKFNADTSAITSWCNSHGYPAP